MFKTLVCLLVAGISCAAGAVYHVDAARGDDSMAGDVPERAWKTLQKANSVVLMPGDRLLFKAGGRWSGQLKRKRSIDGRWAVLAAGA